MMSWRFALGYIHAINRQKWEMSLIQQECRTAVAEAMVVRLQKDYNQLVRAMLMTIQQTETEEDNVVPFKKPKLELLQGGREPPGGNWLVNLNRYAIFLAKDPRSEIDIFEYHVIFKAEHSVLLKQVSGGQEHHIWVDPIEFCKKYKLWEIMANSSGEELSE